MVQETSQKKKGRAAGIILTVIAVVILLPVCRYVIQKLGLAVPPVVLQLVVFVAAGIVIAKFVRDTYVYHYCIDEKTLHIYRSVGRWDSPLCSIDASNFKALGRGEQAKQLLQTAPVAVSSCYSVYEPQKETVLLYRTGLKDHVAAVVLMPSDEMFEKISKILLDKSDKV